MLSEPKATFYFSYDDPELGVSSSITREFTSTPVWDELLPVFKTFLQSVGYQFPEGAFEYVESEE